MEYKFVGTPGPWTLTGGELLYHDGRRFYDLYLITKEFDQSHSIGNNIVISNVRNPHLDRPDLNPLTEQEARSNAIAIGAVPELLGAMILLLKNEGFDLRSIISAGLLLNESKISDTEVLQVLSNAERVLKRALGILDNKQNDE